MSPAMKRFLGLRALWLWVQLAGGCAHVEQAPLEQPYGVTLPGYVSPSFLPAEPSETATLNALAGASLPRSSASWWSRAPVDEAALRERDNVKSASVADVAGRGLYGMLKGAAAGAVVGAIGPFGPVGAVVGAPIGAVMGLIGGAASPSSEAIAEWKVVPASNPWPDPHANDRPKRRTTVVVASAPVHHAQPKPTHHRPAAGNKSSPKPGLRKK